MILEGRTVVTLGREQRLQYIIEALGRTRNAQLLARGAGYMVIRVSQFKKICRVSQFAFSVSILCFYQQFAPPNNNNNNKLKHKTPKSNLYCLNLIFGKSYTFSRLQSQPVRWEGDLLADMYGAFQLYHLCIQQSISETRGNENEAWVICSLKLQKAYNIICVPFSGHLL